ncbi:MAG: T9SS type A sorting domain-containing protein [Bacteroidota bacterium]
MIRPLLLLGWCLVCWLSSWAQPTYLEVEGTNAVQFSVRSDGLLFNNPSGAKFRLDEDSINMMQGAGLWISGVTPAGDPISMRSPLEEGQESDFKPGFLDPETGEVLGANQFWRIDRRTLQRFFSDYGEDLIVDLQIPAIFGWPGRNNAFFEEIHGYALPEDKDLAPFWDQNGNGNYEPDQGDYPSLDVIGCSLPFMDELIWFAYHTPLDTLPSGLLFKLEVYAQVYTFACDTDPILNQSVFVNKQIFHRGIELVYDVQVGMGLDFSIGCPEDDYIGSYPEINSVFAYNANEQDALGCEEGFESSQIPSMVAFQQIDCYYESEDDPYENNYLATFKPLWPNDDSRPPGMQQPVTPLEYFYFFSGTWRDQTPLTYGGDGYQDGTEEVSMIFSDSPQDNEGWSERTALQSPGKRKALATSPKGIFYPDDVIEVNYAFTIFNDPQATSVDDEFEDFYNRYEGLHSFMDCSHTFEGQLIVCNEATSIQEQITRNQSLDLFPNPARAQVHLQLHQGTVEQVRLLGMDGKMLQQFSATNSPIEQIDIAHLRVGVYIVQVVTSEGKWANQKLVVSR